MRSWFVYVVKLPQGVDRDGVMRRMDERGVATAPYVPSIHLQSYMRERYGFREGMFPVSEDTSARTMALPFHARLGETTRSTSSRLCARARVSASSQGTVPKTVESGRLFDRKSVRFGIASS